MEQVPENAPLAEETRVGSEDPLMEPTVTGPTRNSNGRALKIAVITTLVCLLLSAQAFTAYMVFDQRAQIKDLQADHERLQADMSRRALEPPKKMVLSLPSSPFVNLFDGLSNTPTSEAKRRPSVEEELREFMKDVELPHFDQSFLDNLQILRQKLDETSWKDFESWMRYWLLFQSAQKTPPPHPATPAPRTKCQVEASAVVGNGLLGSFRPECDELGNYKSRQCLASTGHCWCVDESGVRIARTNARGHPDCDKVRSSRTSSDSAMMPLVFGYPD